ncbi:MAG: antitoxin YefM [Oleispira sp.]|jgi:antitoxin YefM
MQTISYSTFRSNLSSVMDSVNDDHKPVLITRQNGKPAVLISVEDFESYQETAYLMQSPNNAQRLNDTMADIEAGKTLSHGLIEE